MNEYQKQDLKKRINEYLVMQGRTPIPTPKNGPCPICGGGHRTPNAGIKDDKLHCFACGWHGDIFDLIGKLESIPDKAAQFRRAETLFHLEQDTGARDSRPEGRPGRPQGAAQAPDHTEYYRRCQANAGPAIAYLEGRGIARDIIDRHGVGYDKTQNAAIIPVTKSYYIARRLSGEQRYSNPGGVQVIPYNLAALNQENPVFIVEGMIDALSIETAGGQAIALHSTSNVNRLGQTLIGRETLPPLILAMDNDEPGRQAQEQLRECLESRETVLIMASDLYGDKKDANDSLKADPEGLRARVNEHAARATDSAREASRELEERRRQEFAAYWQENSTAAYMGRIHEIVEETAARPAIPTGFDALDAALDGGLYEGLYIIGAISSLGKTTFALQIADNIAAGGQDVLLFSLEMSRYELAGKSISRQTFFSDCSDSRSLAKTTRQILDGSRYRYYTQEELALIDEAVEAYKAAAGNIFILESDNSIGADEVRAAAEKHKLLTGNYPVIVIDYLQILKPKSDKGTEKQNTDYSVTELKRISRKTKKPVIAISSLNRENYTAPISMVAFKESGAIEYSSDVLIGLQVAGADEYRESDRAKNNQRTERLKKEDPRRLELKVLKNRNGAMPDKLAFEFYPKYNCFIGLPKGHSWEIGGCI